MLEVTYKTAWFMAHRIREAMREGQVPPMGGEGQIVEADETFFADLSHVMTSGRAVSVGDGHALGTVLNDDAQTLVALDGAGNLGISDTVPGSKADTVSVSYDIDTGEIAVTDPNNTVETHIGTQVAPNTVRVPVAAIAGSVIVDTGGSDDTVALGGDIIPLTVEIRGGEGTDTLVGRPGDDVFTITGPDSGTINGAAFTEIQNLAGGSGDDAFIFTGGAVSSVAGGGGTEHGDDVLVRVLRPPRRPSPLAIVGG